MIEQYEIRKRIEETYCDTCGAPLLIGDKAVCDDATMKVYCSEFCARAGERNNAPLLKPQPAGGVKMTCREEGMANLAKFDEARSFPSRSGWRARGAAARLRDT